MKITCSPLPQFHRSSFPLPPSRYRGHVPNVAFSFGDTYGNTTMKSFQDFQSTAMESSCSPYSKGGQFPTLFSPDPGLVLGARARGWDGWLYTPSYSRFNLDFNRSEELKAFYKVRRPVGMHLLSCVVIYTRGGHTLGLRDLLYFLLGLLRFTKVQMNGLGEWHHGTARMALQEWHHGLPVNQ